MKAVAPALVSLALVATVSAAQRPPVAAGPDLEVTGRWHSRYVTEGRDRLGGDDLYSVAGGLEWDGWAAGGWFGVASGQDYREMELFVERGFDLGPTRVHGRYTRRQFLADDRDDDEVAGGITLTALGDVRVGGEYTYSANREGGFLALTLAAEITMFDQLALTPSLMQGFDYGYASDSHDGASNLRAGLDATLRLGERLRLVGSVAHSRAQADVENAGGGDLTWVTVGLSTDI